jgi:transposase
LVQSFTILSAKKLVCYDHAEESLWRHLDECQFKTIFIGLVPRVDCPEHGIKSVTVPWAFPDSRFAIMFEMFAIEVLLMTQVVKGAQIIRRQVKDSTWRIIERAVARGRYRMEPSGRPRIGIDEKVFPKGRTYVSILYNLDNSTVPLKRSRMDTTQMQENPSFLS